MVLVLLLVDLGPIFGQASKIFTGKITEIAKGTELDIAKHGTFYILRLDEYAKVQFRLTSEDAVSYRADREGGADGGSDPQDEQGYGLAGETDLQPELCRRSIKAPIYRVISVKLVRRLG